VKSKATQKLAEGLDTASVGEYLAHYTAAFLNPPSSQHQQAADRRVSGEAGGGDESEAEEGEGGERLTERQRTQALDQVVAVLKMPAASEDQRKAVLTFLATHAFFSVPTAPSTATPTPGTKGKKGKAKEAPPPATCPELQQASQALQGGAPPLSSAIRSACAQRLLTHIAAVPGGNQAASSNQEDKGSGKPGGKRKQQGQGEGEQHPGQGQGQGEPAGKRAKGADGLPRPVHVHVDPARLLGPIVAHVRSLQSGGAPLAGELGEEADAALTLLR
jgi:hypothetical protein